MKALIEQIQRLINVDIDGVFGPNTTKVIAIKLKCEEDIKSIQRVIGVAEDGKLGHITLNAIISKLDIKKPKSGNSDKLIAIAKTQLGIHETSRNHGDGIAKYWTATNYPDGYDNREPYCAACVCWCIKESNIFDEKERPKTAAAFGFENWADNLYKKTKITRKPTKVKKGQLVIFSFSHIGIATSDSDNNNLFSTIEANTGANGSRDGDGIYAKVRNISVVRSVITIF
jgi:hypothetical protein